jgi:hypothetical protein
MHLVAVTLQCISCCLDLLPEGTAAPPACLRDLLYFTCEVALVDVASFGTEHTAGGRVRSANSEETFAEMLMSPHYLEVRLLARRQVPASCSGIVLHWVSVGLSV